MPSEKTKLSLPDYKHLLTAGGLIAGTLGTLVLGAALRVDPQAGAAEPLQISAPPVAGGSAVHPTPLPADDPAPPSEVPAPPARASAEPGRTAPSPQPTPRDPVADRSDDARRITSAGGDWTLQFMVTCNRESAERVLEDVGSDERLFVLPIQLDGRPCLRICWDTFRTRELALAAGVPAALQKLNAEPMARPVDDLIP